MYDARPMRALRVLVVLVPSLLVAGPASAWTAPTRVRMVDDAVKILPPALRSVLEKRREATLRGMLGPMTEEDDAGHRPTWDGGSLESSVEAAYRALVKAVDSKASFTEVARRFGLLAHYIADAGFPPGAAGRAGDRRYAHFAAFCESRRDRIPLVFYGHANDALAHLDFHAFAYGVIERARAQDVVLARAYAAAPSWDDPASFDDRSVPFAVASLSYSHSVTDVVQGWLAAWRACHGDLGGTPYMDAQAPR